MYDLKVEVAGEIALALNRLRHKAGLSIAEAANTAKTSEIAIINAETGFPVPYTELVVLLIAYKVAPGVAGDYLECLLARRSGS